MHFIVHLILHPRKPPVHSVIRILTRFPRICSRVLFPHLHVDGTVGGDHNGERDLMQDSLLAGLEELAQKMKCICIRLPFSC